MLAGTARLAQTVELMDAGLLGASFGLDVKIVLASWHALGLLKLSR
jgi:hypothetical protein